VVQQYPADQKPGQDEEKIYTCPAQIVKAREVDEDIACDTTGVMVRTRVEIEKMVQQHEADGDTAEAVKFWDPRTTRPVSATFQRTVSFMGIRIFGHG
jgi:hypothetical protein